MRPGLLAVSIVALMACDDPPAPTLTTVTVSVLDVDERPLANATVIVDANGRTTKTTDATGKVSLEVDLAAGAIVTAFTPDHTVVTMLEATPETVVRLPRLDRLVRDRTVLLSGALTKKTDPTTTIDLSASGVPRLGSARTDEDRYELRVPRDQEFFLLGHELRVVEGEVTVANEHLRAFRLEGAPRTGDQTLDIDVAAAPPVKARALHLRAQLPEGSVFDNDRTKATGSVRSLDSQLLVGALTSSKTNAVGTRDIELAVAETDVGGERLVTRVVLSAANGAASIRTEPGIANEATVFSDFALPPPVPDATNRTLADPIPLDGFPAGATLRINAFANNQLFWIIQGPPNTLAKKTVTLPSPAGVQFNTDVQLVALSVEARFDGDKRVAIAPDLIVRRQ